MENKFDELLHSHVLVATLKVRLAKRERQHSIPPLNLKELNEDRSTVCSRGDQQVYGIGQNEVTPEDL